MTTPTPDTNTNTTNNRGTTMERNDHDNDWQRMDDNNTPPHFKCGRVFFSFV
jgi:hypothetical protein